MANPISDRADSVLFRDLRDPRDAVLEQLRWLALISVPGAGPVRLQPILHTLDGAPLDADRCDPQGWDLQDSRPVNGSETDIWQCRLRWLSAQTWCRPEALHQLEQRIADPFLPVWPERDQLLQWLQTSADHQLLTLADDSYPFLLREIADPPLMLFLKGRMELLHQPQLAIVGSRRPSAVGMSDARSFAASLAGLGWTITSGLAQGIDAAAHSGALQAGGGTIAVLGTGIDRCYPLGHQSLMQQIAEQGLLVSEFPLETPPRAGHFPRRNRIVSGLSLGVLVVEAALKSGSLISARLAAEQGREVFAIPGSIHHAGSKGCHQLIREGARLTECIQDIHEELSGWLASPVSRSKAMSERPHSTRQERLPAASATSKTPKDREVVPQPAAEHFSSPQAFDLYRQLSRGSVNTDQLVLALGWPVDEVCRVCLELELSGKIRQSAGLWQVVRPI